MGGSVRMGEAWESEKASQRGLIPEQQERWRRRHSSRPQHAQRPWGRDTECWASTNSSEMTRHLDLMQIFQKTNRQMPLRVSDALNLFSLIPIKGKALHYYG